MYHTFVTIFVTFTVVSVGFASTFTGCSLTARAVDLASEKCGETVSGLVPVLLDLEVALDNLSGSALVDLDAVFASGLVSLRLELDEALDVLAGSSLINVEVDFGAALLAEC